MRSPFLWHNSNIKNLKNPKTFKSWLNTIITNIFYDELRKQEKKPNTISIDETICENSGQSISSLLLDKKCKPHEICVTNEIEKLIKEAILNLPEHFKIAIVLRELQGLSYEEIANATHASVGTVKSRIARARCKLQEGLKSFI